MAGSWEDHQDGDFVQDLLNLGWAINSEDFGEFDVSDERKSWMGGHP